MFTSEKDLSFVAQQVGVTTLGTVGETVKGPAFEPIFITNYEEFTAIFGGQNPAVFGGEDRIPKFELPYIARNYLSQSNQLFITRILGLTGYDAGHSSKISEKANNDPSTQVSAGTATWTASYSGSGTYYGFAGAGATDAEELFDLGLFPAGSVGAPLVPSNNIAYPHDIVFTKVGGSFEGISTSVINTGGGSSTGTTSGTVTTWTASAYTQFDNMVVAMMRSRGSVTSDVLSFDTFQSATGLQMDPGGVPTNPLANFVLSASSSSTSAVTTSYDVSLNEKSRNYLPCLLYTSPSPRD